MAAPLTQDEFNFQRMTRAIEYLSREARRQPTLEETAHHVGMSPHHFQRTFTQWAGTSPKKFVQYLTLGYAKRLLEDHAGPLWEVAHASGLSGSGRLHDLFLRLEGMTPGEYRQGGEALTIFYSFEKTPFGLALVASTSVGICHLAFCEESEGGLRELQHQFPRARFIHQSVAWHTAACAAMAGTISYGEPIALHLRGTPFQLKVWEALLQIPAGQLTTYGRLAAHVGQPRAARAVGSAVGDNPVAWLIPCHRVIQASGLLGQYRWGAARKQAIIGCEAAARENAK